MASNTMVSAGRAAQYLLAGGGSAPGQAGGRGLAVATLASWLTAELLGAYMLRNWIASGGSRDREARPHGLSPALIFWHAGLALAGLVSWVTFLVTRSAAPAWLAIGFLAPAIGLGISTVTVWTPYPARRSRAEAESAGRTGHGVTGGAGEPGCAGESTPTILVTNEMLDRALANEALTSKLVDDLLERMLTEPGPAPHRDRKSQFAPLIPILHGALALATFLLAMLAAIAALTLA